MTGFEPRTSSSGRDRSANWASKNVFFSKSETFVRKPKRRPEPEVLDDDLQFGEDFQSAERSPKAESASEQVAVRLAFPGNDYVREARAIGKSNRILFTIYSRRKSDRLTSIVV